MATRICVNLPVKDLNRSVEFFTKVGYNAQSIDENATSLIIAENINVMLLVENFFKTLVDKEICDTTTSTESIICLSVESREAVDELVARAVAAGGIANEPED